jgi:hypothetical protein
MEKRINIINDIFQSLIELIEDSINEEEVNREEIKRKVGRPKIHETSEIRKAYHSNKLKETKYSTSYYRNNKRRVICEHCGKNINNLAKCSHYKSKKCMAVQKENETTI